MTIELRDNNGVLKATFTERAATSLLDNIGVKTLPYVIKHDLVMTDDRRTGVQRFYLWKGDKLSISKIKY